MTSCRFWKSGFLRPHVPFLEDPRILRLSGRLMRVRLHLFQVGHRNPRRPLRVTYSLPNRLCRVTSVRTQAYNAYGVGVVILPSLRLSDSGDVHRGLARTRALPSLLFEHDTTSLLGVLGPFTRISSLLAQTGLER